MNNQIGIVNELLRKMGLGHIIPFEGWLGNKDTAWGNIYIFSLWTGLGGSTMLYFSSAMTRMPESLFESADLDGATEMRKLWSIVVPLIWPVYCTMCITSLGIVFSWHLPSLLMTGGGPEGSTATIGIIIISEARAMSNIGLVSAMGVYIFVIGGTLITLAKHFMTKLYEEVEY
jgi:multiple sugar transport system permease protein